MLKHGYKYSLALFGLGDNKLWYYYYGKQHAHLTTCLLSSAGDTMLLNQLVAENWNILLVQEEDILLLIF